MSKITKKQLHNGWHCHDTEIIKIKKELRELKQSVLRLEKLTDEKLLDKPQLKQLDQSVFKGSPDWAVSAAISPDGKAYVYSVTGDGFYGISDKYGYQIEGADRAKRIGGEYDTSNWQNSLIERDTTKEITGSDLCRAMLARGDKYILCLVGDGGDYRVANQGYAFIVTGVHSNGEFDTPVYTWEFAVPINNQGEPLTASEVGL